MRQNKMMRCASLLLVGVLATTCSITSAYAKYTSKGIAEDSAKVARWGVVVSTEGKLFDTSYLSGSDGGTPGNGMLDGEDNTVLSVESIENVIAPGTKNDTGLTFKVEGSPEVDVEVKVTASTTSGDVYLNGSKLPDVTTSEEGDTFSADYYFPVKYTLKKNGTVMEGHSDLTLSQLIAKLKALSGRYDAGTELSGADGFGTYNISWEWTYEGDDKADSLLGSLTPDTTELDGLSVVEGVNYNLETDLKIEISVTQID